MGSLRYFWFQWGLLMKLFLKFPQNVYRIFLFSQNPETYLGIKHSVLKRVCSSCSFVQRSEFELCHTLWELRYSCPVVPGSRSSKCVLQPCIFSLPASVSHQKISFTKNYISMFYTWFHLNLHWNIPIFLKVSVCVCKMLLSVNKCGFWETVCGK